MRICVPRKRDGVITGYYIWCVACKHAHVYEVPGWSFNGNLEKPSFTPSLLEFYTKPGTNQRIITCHFFVTDGIIKYCGDCPHELNCQNLPLEQIPENYHLGGADPDAQNYAQN